MRIVAIVLWLACLLDILLVSQLTITGITMSGANGETTTKVVGFFEGITFTGAILYGAIFALFVGGCVFWVGSELAKRLGR